MKPLMILLQHQIQLDQLDQNLHTSGPGLDTSKNALNKHYLFNGKYYEIMSIIENKLIAKCQLCLKIIQGQIGSTGNLFSPIKVRNISIY